MTALSPRQMFFLDEACKPIREAFGGSLYLVGTASEKQSYRDVDVRLILDNRDFDSLAGVVGLNAIVFLGFAIGEYLASRTGLPIDFQFQRLTQANENHDGNRNPLGLRDLQGYTGDALPPRPTTGKDGQQEGNTAGDEGEE